MSDEQDQGRRDGGVGTRDDLKRGTAATSMTDGCVGAPSDQGRGRSDASPIGRASPPAGGIDPAGLDSRGGSPTGPAGGGATDKTGAEGSLGSSTYNDQGDVTGLDSPAGDEAQALAGEGQGDNLADPLGGGDNTLTGLSGAGSVTGD